MSKNTSTSTSEESHPMLPTSHETGSAGSGQSPTSPPTLPDPLLGGKRTNSCQTDVLGPNVFLTFSPNTCIELLPTLTPEQTRREISYQRDVLKRDITFGLATDNSNSMNYVKLRTQLTKDVQYELDRAVFQISELESLTQPLSCAVRDAETFLAEMKKNLTPPSLPPPLQPAARTSSSYPASSRPTTTDKPPIPVRFIPDASFTDISVDDVTNGLNFRREGTRLVAHLGSKGYRYGRDGHPPKSYPDSVAICDIMLELAIALENVDFSPDEWCCTVNMYPDGSATIPWHCDDEPEIDPGSDIVCVSLGAPRAIKFRTVGGKKVEQSHDLPTGSVYCMSRESQEYWEHSVPANPECKAPRASLTFRKLRDPQVPTKIPPIAPPTRPTSPEVTPKTQRLLLLTDSIHSGLPAYLFPAHVQFVKRPMYQLTELDKFEHLFNQTDYVVISSGVNDLSRYNHRAHSLWSAIKATLDLLAERYPGTTFVFNSILHTRFSWLNTEIDELNRLVYEYSFGIDNLNFFDSHAIATRIWMRGGHVLDPQGNGIHLYGRTKGCIGRALVANLCGLRGQSPLKRPEWPIRPNFLRLAAGAARS